MLSYIPSLDRERSMLGLNLPPRCHISLSCITCFDIGKRSIKRAQSTRLHRIALFIVVIIIAMLTFVLLCYVMAHDTLLLYYHSSMLTRQPSLRSGALDCHGMILGSVESVHGHDENRSTF